LDLLTARLHLAVAYARMRTEAEHAKATEWFDCAKDEIRILECSADAATYEITLRALHGTLEELGAQLGR
jgi:hypothetical protein